MTESAKTGGPTAVPFLELMRRVPVTYRAEWESHFADDGRPIGHSYAPAGKMLHEAANEIERLTAERDRLRDEVAEARQLNEAWRLADLKTEAELAVCRVDAERYRWIRGRTGAFTDEFIWPANYLKRHIEGVKLMQGSVAEHLDVAIDAALDRAAQEKAG